MLGLSDAYGKRQMKDIPFKIDRNGSANLPEQVAAFDFDGKRLVIKKSGSGSAAYRFVFSVCEDL